jgi:ParB family chromosome partitioning protein
MPSALGKGLSSLIPEDTLDKIQQPFIPNLPIEKIVPNSQQPRIEIDPEKLIELADSIREHGVIEPLIVTQRSIDNYELIAGERRWRAAKLAGVKTVPVVVKEASPLQMLELAIVENIQREDLNPLEEAMAFEHLHKKFSLSHEEIAQKVGYSRPAIVNKIRLLKLPEAVKKGLIENKLSEGHARALLGLKNFEAIEIAFRVIIRDSLSVRATEKLVQKLNTAGKAKQTPQKVKLDARLIQMEKTLKEKLKSKVSLVITKTGGRITIPFKTQHELDQIYKLIEKGIA